MYTQWGQANFGKFTQFRIVMSLQKSTRVINIDSLIRESLMVSPVITCLYASCKCAVNLNPQYPNNYYML